MCTGPFVLTDWTPGDSITVERNDNYWDSENLAKTQEIKFEFVTDASALTRGAGVGRDRRCLRRAPDHGELGRRHRRIWARARSSSRAPFGRGRDRSRMSASGRRISLVIDRQAVADSIFKDSAIGSWSYYSPATWTYSAGTSSRPRSRSCLHPTALTSRPRRRWSRSTTPTRASRPS